jgi:hypothetical protein
MSRTCFCGCARPIGRACRKLNRDGEHLHELLAGVHGFVLPGLEPEPGLTDDERQEVERARANMQAFADEGTGFRADLVRVLHDEASVRELDRPKMQAWMSAALELNEAALRRRRG